MRCMKEISSNFCKLSSVKNLFFKFFESFKVKVCGRDFFNSLKVWSVWKKGLWCWGKAFSLQGCKENRSPFLNEWEVWKRFLQVFFKISSFKVKVCEREFFDSLKVWGVWKKALWVIESVKFQVCQRKFFALLQVSSEISSLCNKRFASDRSFSFQVYVRGQRFSSKAFNLLRECLL